MGAQGVSALGIMEADPLVVQAEEKLISQADELIVLVDSSKFERRSSLVLCGLDKVSRIVTDDGIPETARRMLEQSGVELTLVRPGARGDENSSAA